MGNEKEQKTDSLVCHEEENQFSTKIDIEKSLTPFQTPKKTAINSTDDILNYIGFGFYQIIIFVTLGTLGMCDGSESLMISFITPVLTKFWSASKEIQTILPTFVYVGYFVGNFCTGFIVDNYGRKRAVVFSSILACVFGLLSAFAPGVWAFIVLRTIFGMIDGFFSPLASIIQIESNPIWTRGKMGMFIGGFYTLGELCIILIAYCSLTSLTEGHWRILVGFASIPAILTFFLSLILLKETPRYLLTKGRSQEAIEVFKEIGKINGKKVDISQEEIERVIQNIGKETEEEKKQNANVLRTFPQLFHRKLWLNTLLLWLAWFSINFSYYGISLLLPTTTKELFSDHSSHENSQRMLFLTYKDISPTLWSTVAEFPVIIVSLLIIDMSLVGRKRTVIMAFLIGGVPCFLTYFLPVSWFTALIAISKYGLNQGFSILFQYTAEIYPTSIRGTGFSIAMCVGRIGGIIMPSILFYLNSLQVLLPYLVVGLLCTFVGLVSFFFTQDTTMTPLEDKIDQKHSNQDENPSGFSNETQSSVSSP